MKRNGMNRFLLLLVFAILTACMAEAAETTFANECNEDVRVWCRSEATSERWVATFLLSFERRSQSLINSFGGEDGQLLKPGNRSLWRTPVAEHTILSLCRAERDQLKANWTSSEGGFVDDYVWYLKADSIDSYWGVTVPWQRKWRRHTKEQWHRQVISLQYICSDGSLWATGLPVAAQYSRLSLWSGLSDYAHVFVPCRAVRYKWIKWPPHCMLSWPYRCGLKRHRAQADEGATIGSSKFSICASSYLFQEREKEYFDPVLLQRVVTTFNLNLKYDEHLVVGIVLPSHLKSEVQMEDNTSHDWRQRHDNSWWQPIDSSAILITSCEQLWKISLRSFTTQLSMLSIIILTVCCLATKVQSDQRYVACDPTCQTNGHVPTCCVTHGFSEGYCNAEVAYCSSRKLHDFDVHLPSLPLLPQPIQDCSKKIRELRNLVLDLKTKVAQGEDEVKKLNKKVNSLASQQSKDKISLEKSISAVTNGLSNGNAVTPADLARSMDRLQANLADEVAKSLSGVQGNVRALEDRVYERNSQTDRLITELQEIVHTLKVATSQQISDLNNLIADMGNRIADERNYAESLSQRITGLTKKQARGQEHPDPSDGYNWFKSQEWDDEQVFRHDEPNEQPAGWCNEQDSKLEFHSDKSDQVSWSAYFRREHSLPAGSRKNNGTGSTRAEICNPIILAKEVTMSE